MAGQCAAAGLTGSRLDDFVLAVHEIAANAIVHADGGGRLILRRAAGGGRPALPGL
jgi:anti-sigma regulatory factor (Ser/Thr protein kinase)